MEMSATLLLKTKYSMDDTKPIIMEALEKQIYFVQARFSGFDRECKEFEKKYRMDSDQFLRKFESGELGDDVQWFDWYASCKGRQLWEKKYKVLSEISWKE
jgi:hypothetical protein